MPLVLTALSALVPSLLLVWFFRSRDAHPEPAGTVWATFGLGVASIVPTLIVALPVAVALEAASLSPVPRGLLDAFLSAALPEEAFKLAVLLLFAVRRPAFDEPMDGVVYGVVASLGFATLENVLYTAQGGLPIAVVRAFTAVPMHAFCGAVMGYYVGRWRFPQETGAGRGALAAAFALPALFHGLYDFPLMALGHMAGVESQRGLTTAEGALAATGGLGLAVVVLVVLVVFALVLLGRARLAQRLALAQGRLVPLAPAPPAPARPLLGWSMILGCGCLASAGGLFALFAAAVLLVDGLVAADEKANVLLGSLVLGLPPLLLGLAGFGWGVRLLPRAAPRRSRYGDAPGSP